MAKRQSVPESPPASAGGFAPPCLHLQSRPTRGRQPALGARPPAASQPPLPLDQADPLQILALVFVLLRDLLRVVLGREIEARDVEALDEFDHLLVIVCLL